MLMRNSLVNVRFAARTTTKPQTRQKALDTMGHLTSDLSKPGVRERVSFWNVFGVPSRAVRLVAPGRTDLFENSLAPRQHLFARRNTTNTRSRRNCFVMQSLTSESSPKKNRLHPTADRRGTSRYHFALSQQRSTPRTEKSCRRSKNGRWQFNMKKCLSKKIRFMWYLRG
jgi:hypothetical protein